MFSLCAQFSFNPSYKFSSKKNFCFSSCLWKEIYTQKRWKSFFSSFFAFLSYFSYNSFFFFSHKKGTINSLRWSNDQHTQKNILFSFFFFSFIFLEDEAIIKTESEEKNNKNHRRGFFFRRVLLIYNVFIASTPKKNERRLFEIRESFNVRYMVQNFLFFFVFFFNNSTFFSPILRSNLITNFYLFSTFLFVFSCFLIFWHFLVTLLSLFIVFLVQFHSFLRLKFKLYFLIVLSSLWWF